MSMLRLLQHRADDGKRSVIASDGGAAHFVNVIRSTRELAQQAIDARIGLAEMISRLGIGEEVDPAAELASGRIIAPIDHGDPSHLMMSGTGLTHLGSADARNEMHRMAAAEKQTDSMRIFLEGVGRGKPADGEVGCQPEWFYKGDGSMLVGPGEPLAMPDFAQDGGEEPELAGVYLIGRDGVPYRLGICLANEFSDHVTERHNYLWLAHSKLRNAALGPELLVGPPPEHVEGTSRIRRDRTIVWEQPFLSGEANMSHSIANLEWHQFKYAQFRRPGDVHVHFFGTATLSCTDAVQTQVGDVFEISAAPFLHPVSNPLALAEDKPVTVRSL